MYRRKIVFASGSVIGIVIFIFLYGVDVLNVTYTDWLKNSGDLTQHYIGWEYYRNSAWTFPLGTISNFIYPVGTSITYTDSIPLFAIFFKIINGILPNQFQYFGLFGIISFALTGGISALIILKCTKDIFTSILLSSFIVLAPIALFRMYTHTALGGHWIILLAILLIFYKSEIAKKSESTLVLSWIITVVLSVLIHPTLTLIVLFILLGNAIHDMICKKELKKTFLTISLPILVGGGTFIAIGGLNSQSSAGEKGLGIYSMNLNALFNPQGNSKYLPNLSHATAGQYEGLQYLGLGGIILLGIAIIYIVLKGKNIVLSYKKWIIPILSIIFISLVASLSPIITYNEITILEYSIPKFIENIWNIFRSSGRLFWGSWYLIIILAIFIVSKLSLSKWMMRILFTIVLIIQVSDLSPMLTNLNQRFENTVIYESPLKSAIWDDLANDVDHLYFLPAYIEQYDHFSYYANEHNMTLNTGYIAHGKGNEIVERSKVKLEDLKNGELLFNELYVIKSEAQLIEIKSVHSKNDDMEIIRVDSFFVIFKSRENINLNDYPDVVNLKK